MLDCARSVRYSYRIGQTLQESPLQSERINPVSNKSESIAPGGVFCFWRSFPYCPKCGGKNNYSVKDGTPDRIYDQLIQQAQQGIQGSYLVDIGAFTGGGT